MKHTIPQIIILLSPAFAGLETLCAFPGAYAPGFILSPAPQAENDLFNELSGRGTRSPGGVSTC
jgi:hypothetical protein